MHLTAWIGELIAFVVVVFVLYRFVWPLIQNMAGARQDAIQQDVDASAEAERKLAEAQRRFDEAVSEARDEAARIRDDARADSHRLREELKEQAQREVERIRQRGEEQLAAQRDLTIRRLRAEIGALSLEEAERRVRAELADEGARSATVDGFLDELGGLSGPTVRSATTAAGTGGNI
ncbi:MAG: F0F1 ATP synthase subunit B [Pseudonocardia sp.]